jgi:hypothetical protein
MAETHMLLRTRIKEYSRILTSKKKICKHDTCDFQTQLLFQSLEFFGQTFFFSGAGPRSRR